MKKQIRVRFLAWDLLKSTLFVFVSVLAYLVVSDRYGHAGRVGFWCLQIGWMIGRIEVVLFGKKEHI